MNFIKKLALSPTVLVLFDQGLSSGANFLLTLFLAQKLDIQNFGLFSSIVLVGYLIMSITNALIIQPFQVSIVKVVQKKEYYVFLFLSMLALLFMVVFLVQIMIFFLPIPSEYSVSINAFLCFIIGLLINDFFRKFFLALNKITSAIIIDAVFLVLIVVFFYIFKDAVQLPNALWIIGTANIVSAFYGIFFIIKNYEIPKSWKIFTANHASQGKWLFSVAILQWCSTNFFVLVSGVYLGIQALAALRLVQSFFGILNVALQTVENFVLPKVSHIYNENVAAAKKYLLKITFGGAILFGIVLSVFFLFSEEIIVLAGGEKYREYGYVVKIIAVLYFFIFLSYPVRIAVRVMVLNKIFFYGYLLSFLSSVVTFHFLLKYSGLYGAVGGLIINQLIMIAYWQNQLKKNHFLLWK